MKTFNAFIDKKQRDSLKHLKIIKKVFESQGMKCTDHLGNDDPYVFLFAKDKDLNFEGIRIYKIGNQLAFRIQKEESTHPFGMAYPLDIEEMFNDLMSDEHNPEKAGKAVIKSMINEVERFFKKTLEAENDLRSSQFDNKDPNGNGIAIRNTVTDFSNLVQGRGN